MAHMKTVPKLLLVAVGAVAAIYGIKAAAERGWIPTPGIMKALVPQKAVLPELKEAQVANVAPLPLPTDSSASVQATLIRGEVWEWNAQANLILANGGATTTKGSLMEKYGANLALYRQDDTNQMAKDLIDCAAELSKGAQQCDKGANFVVIMGDQGGGFFAGLNPQLKKLGPQWQAKVIGSTGRSDGEDAFMAPPEVKRNAQQARGLLVAGSLREGDWDVALKWEGDNDIPNNPDENTYDPEAVNWLGTGDYLKAAEAYNAGQCQDRKVVKDGKLTGQTKHICVNGVVTWTPGDVNVAKGKGGLVKVVSTRQYRSQMPAVIIGPKAFFDKNRDEVTGMLAATLEAGDQMKAYDKALHKAMALSAQVYQDQNEAYWYKYFKGTTETDAQNVKVDLGGSAVANLADEQLMFGIGPGVNDNFRSTYTIFAGIATQQYPALFKETPIPDVKDIEDKSFITGAAALLSGSSSEAEPVRYSSSGPVVSKRSYSINFDTNKATFRPEGEETMRQLRDSIAITGLAIRVDGYTDNQGTDQVNASLSQARADAVKVWLQQKAAANFPSSRFSSVRGHGAQDPVASNTTAEGRAENRRVVITLTGE